MTTTNKSLKRSTTVTGSARKASIPDKGIAAKYVHRSFPGGLSDFDIFELALNNGWPVLIEGPTGPGKTMASMAYAAEHDMAFYAVPSNIGVDPTQMFGKFVPNKSKANPGDPDFVWVDGGVTDLVRHGGVLLINEVNFLPPRIATVLFGLLDARREITLLDHEGETIRAHQGTDCWCGAADCMDKRLLIVADMNPSYEGTQKLNMAFRNRFKIQLNWGYDPAVEAKLVQSDTLRDLAAKLRAQHEAQNIETPTSTNMLMEFETMVGETGSLDFAMMVFVNHFAAEERQAVQMVLDASRENLEQDYEDDGEDEEPGVQLDPELAAAFNWSGIVDDNDSEFEFITGR